MFIMELKVFLKANSIVQISSCLFLCLSQDGDTPLHNAAINDHLAIVKKLIESGARVDEKDDVCCICCSVIWIWNVMLLSGRFVLCCEVRVVCCVVFVCVRVYCARTHMNLCFHLYLDDTLMHFLLLYICLVLRFCLCCVYCWSYIVLVFAVVCSSVLQYC